MTPRLAAELATRYNARHAALVAERDHWPPAHPEYIRLDTERAALEADARAAGIRLGRPQRLAALDVL